jgi:hypothetical protein
MEQEAHQESLQEYHLSHHAYVEVPEHLFIREPNRAFADGLRNRNIKKRYS